MYLYLWNVLYGYFPEIEIHSPYVRNNFTYFLPTLKNYDSSFHKKPSFSN